MTVTRTMSDEMARSFYSPVVHPRLNKLGLMALSVATVGFFLNITSGLLAIGWLVSAIGAVLAFWALLGTERQTRKEAVAALITTIAAGFAVVGMWRDVVAPFL